MEVPGCTNSNLTSWLRCKLCGGFFSQLSEFIQHKQQWHLADFQRANSHSIVFEEVIPNGSQESRNDFKIERAQVDSAAKISQLQFAQEVQVSKNLEDVSASSVSVTVSQYGNTNEEEKKITQLITFDENFQHQVDVANQNKNDNIDNFLVSNIDAQPNSTVLNTEKVECSKLQNSTDSGLSSHDSVANASLPQVRLKRLTLQQIETAINSTHKNCKTSRSSNSQNVTSSQLFKKNSCGNTASSNLNSNFKRFKCVHPGCLKAFKTRYHCKRHFAVHSKRRLELNCKTTKKVIQKLRRPQSAVDKQKESARPFSCPHLDCFSRFTAKRSLQRHAVTHMDDVDRPVFICEICKDVFWYEDNLKTHYKMFHQEGRPDRPFKCMVNDCSASYNWKNTLRKHEKRHN